MRKNNKTVVFIGKAEKIHGDRYDYSLVDYIRADLCVKIKCKEHGCFDQTPNSHLVGCGCKLCHSAKMSLTFEQFLNDCAVVHGDKYDYSKTTFKTTKDKAIFICKIHGDFTQRVAAHLLGSGCKKCSVEKRVSVIKDVVKQANELHHFKYDYSNV